ncbi:MAG: hypothetical protein U0744_07335 [Gemmataceae bacterium]
MLGLTGSKLFDGHSEERVIKELKPTKIRGVPSDLMVCSMQELGINFDKELNEGIIYLDDDVAIEAPLADVMGDIVLEIDVLPNMARKPRDDRRCPRSRGPYRQEAEAAARRSEGGWAFDRREGCRQDRELEALRPLHGDVDPECPA